MTYVPLPIIDVKVADLLLDLDNYRIPTRRQDEDAALKYLFASEDVVGTARLILRNGYFDNEVPIVTPDSSYYVVLEGNRRIGALKALHDPSIVPSHEHEVQALLKRYAIEAQNLPTIIRVLVAPDRSVAAPHIARLHTGLSKRRWSRDQQATFYYSLLDASTTVEDVKAQYPNVDVARFIKMAVMRRLLIATQLGDPSLRIYAASDDLKMSAFEYAYRNKDIAEAISVEFDRGGHLRPLNSTPDQIAAIEYLLNEFRASRLNTRSPEFKKNDPAHADLMAHLRNAGQPEPSSTAPSNTQPSPVPTPSQSAMPSDHPTDDGMDSSDQPTEDGSDSSDQPANEPPSTTRGPNHPNTKTTLDLSGVDYSSAPVNLKHRYHELGHINVIQFPTATAMLLRSVLESTIKFHFESTSTPVAGELTKIFPQVATTYGNIKALKDAINTIRSGNAQKPGSIQWFNLMSHSADAVVTVDDVRLGWQQVNPLIRHLLRPSARSTP